MGKLPALMEHQAGFFLAGTCQACRIPLLLLLLLRYRKIERKKERKGSGDGDLSNGVCVYLFKHRSMYSIV